MVVFARLPPAGFPELVLVGLVRGGVGIVRRDEIEELITRHGGRAASSVSKNTDYLLAGEKAGSKLEKAEQLGVKVISEDEFERLLR
jgi:DNA ligase (NAD+)